MINSLRNNPPKIIKPTIVQPNLKMFSELLTVFETPQAGKKYFIGADVAEGLEMGDSSSAMIIDDDFKQVAYFHGKIDPDLYGKCLVELARIYNGAVLVPEVNNMGHTTLNAIKQMGYLKLYVRSVQDEIEANKETAKLGWVTSSKSKQKMLNELIRAFRDGDITILDLNLLREISTVVRENDGDVILNGKDRTVAACLAIMGTTQSYEPATVLDPNKKERVIFERMDKGRELIARKEKK